MGNARNDTAGGSRIALIREMRGSICTSPVRHASTFYDEAKNRVFLSDLAEKAKPWWRRETTWAMGSLGYYGVRKVPLHLPHLLKAYAVTVSVVLFLIWVG